LFLIRHMNVEGKIMPRQGGESLVARQDIYDYPLVALREAVVNAVAHRNYNYDGSHIYVHMYPDHIDIENPGGLYRGLTLENLGRRSVRRNRLIADLLHRAHYIERVGSGFDRMKHALSDNNNPPFDVSATNFFDIRFYQRIKDIAVDSLTSRQILIYALFQEGNRITKKDIAVALQISEDTALREINALIKLSLVIKLGIGKATVYTRRG